MLIAFVLIMLSLPVSSFVFHSRNILKSRSSLFRNIPTNANTRLECCMSTMKPKVAVCGGGISACIAASELAKKGFEVHIFEVARGLGGRMATRRNGEFHFDHGTRNIPRPRSEEFKKIVHDWSEKKWIKPWQNTNFGIATLSDTGTFEVIPTCPARYVAVPYMSHLCKNLAEHENIICHFNTKVIPIVSEKDTNHAIQWHIQKEFDETIISGEYDWVIVGDRSITSLMSPASDKPADQELLDTIHARYTKPILDVYQSIPVVVLMVVLPEYPLKQIVTFDCIEFLSDNKYGTVLSRITNECSKPDREPVDEKVSWVIQSTYGQAKQVMSEVDKLPGSESFTFEERRAKVNELSQQILLPAFRDALIDIALYEAAHNVSIETNEVFPYDAAEIRSNITELFSTPPEVVIGHRWSAAISNAVGSYRNIIPSTYYSGLSFVDTSMRFAACGDYLPEDEQILSTVEGAVMSGYDTAKRIVDFCYPPSPTPVIEEVGIEEPVVSEQPVKDYASVFGEVVDKE